MADSAVTVTAGTGTSIDTRTEGTNGNHRQVVVLGDPSTNAGVAPVDATSGVKVNLGADNDVTVTGTVTVDGSGVTQPVSGTVTANLSSTDNTVLDNIDSNTDSGAVVGGGLEATAQRVTIASDSTGVLTVDDGGGSLTVDGTVTETNSTAILADTANIDTNVGTIAGAVAGSEMQVDVVTMPTVTVDLGANNDVTVTSGNITADTELTTGDLDTGAGTDTRAVVGLVGSASGGGELIPGSATDGLLVNLGANNDVAVTGTVDLGATDNAVLDNIDTNTDSGAVVGGGTEATAQRVTIANDSTGVLTVDDGGSSLTVDGTVTETNSAAILADTANMDTNLGTVASAVSGTEMQVDVVASIPAGTNTVGNVGIIPQTSGGLSIFRSIDIDESEEEIKSTAGQLFSISAFNTTAAPLYLKFYNLTAAGTTVGTSTPVLTFVVPGNADSDGAGFVWNNDIGFQFDTAMTVACTTAVADADTGAPGANACIVNIGYK